MKIPLTSRMGRPFSVSMNCLFSLLKNKFLDEMLLHSIINEFRISILCFKLKSIAVIMCDNTGDQKFLCT